MGVTVLLLMSACSTFYYGYSKAEWEALSPDEQARAKQEYADVIAEHNKNIFPDPLEKADQDFKERVKDTRSPASPDPL